jgi:serine/threonine protein kinase/TolB-like protein/Tfp pilus assembly protein PilF
MADDRWLRVKRLFEAAVEQPPPERSAFVSAAAADDDTLRREVEELLEADGASVPLLDHWRAASESLFAELRVEPAPPGAGSMGEVSIEPRHPSHVGPYRLLSVLGSGGMGVVYLAEQEQPLRRRVALKLVRPGLDTASVLRRFDAERQALALMTHPSITRVLDAGADEAGRPYFVMELVEGGSITRYCDEHRLTTAARLALFADVCAAVQHAHQKGIIHRDLKPSNILVIEEDGRPVPKIIDFGVAKALEHRLTEATLFTELGVIVGTPEYMSPEQADSRARDIDTRTDVYALGVVLYELLVGAQPFDAAALRDAGFDEMRRIIRDVDPPTPSSRLTALGAAAGRDVAHRRRTDTAALRRLLHGELDWVCLKALEKDRTRRYGSASELASDLGRFARNEPVTARPPAVHYRLRKYLRRRRVGVAASIAIVLALASGFGASALFPSRATDARGSGQDTHAGTRAGSPAERIKLVVLPFANQSEDSAQDYLSDGLTDELITELSRLHPERLGVIPRTTAVRYHRTLKDVSQLGRELGVDYFIEGSALRAGSRVRVAVRLVDARDQTQVWAERYERELDDLLIVQAEVARSVAAKVTVALTPEQQARLDARAPIDPDAYEHYLKGRYYLDKRTELGLKRAVNEFEAAERKQPRYAAALAGIASSYILLTYYGYLPPDQAAPRARAASLKALELDDRLPEAHISLAGIYDGYDHRWADAEEAYRAALRLNPDHPIAHQWYANLLIARDRREEAQAHILRARELDPLSLIIQANVANIFLLSRQYDRAIVECRKALDMEEDFVVARWVLGRAMELQGQYPTAAAEFERALQREPDNTLLRAALARTYAVSGARAKAHQHLQVLEETTQRRYVSPLDLVLVHAALGQANDAFASLERAVRDRANLLKFLKVDPAYDSLRGDPRFRRTLGMIGLE